MSFSENMQMRYRGDLGIKNALAIILYKISSSRYITVVNSSGLNNNGGKYSV